VGRSKHERGEAFPGEEFKESRQNVSNFKPLSPDNRGLESLASNTRSRGTAYTTTTNGGRRKKQALHMNDYK